MAPTWNEIGQLAAIVVLRTVLNYFLQRARLIVADGAIAGLSFKVAAALLKTVALQSWQQIAMFAAILALRTMIKTELKWQIRVQRYPKQVFQAR